MNWFYAYQGQRAGPANDEEFARLVSDGTVVETTLVWHSGMPDWMPFAQARAIPLAPPPGAAGDPTANPSSPAAFGGVYQAQCSQCGRVFPADEVIRLEGFNVCAACKPLLIQKIRQGMSPAVGAYGVMPARYGGFWIRFGAVFLDGLIMLPVSLILSFAAARLYPAALVYNPRNGIAPQLIYQAVSFTIQAVYDVFFTGRFGGTPGKLICGLRVVRSDGSRVTYARALGRFFAKVVNYFTLTIGFIIAGFDSQKRALHDYMADTRVVFKE